MADMDVPVKVDHELDASGMNCPLPLLKCKQQLNKMEAGEVLLLTATDSGSWRDIHSYIRLSQHQLQYAEESEGVYKYWIEAGAARQ
ncbi:sulfurtransferase TusA family protein [Spongorhabdus nitratireducens]